LLPGLCFLETGTAQHRPALRGPEGDRRLLATCRASGARLSAYAGTSVRTLRLALLATLGIVLKLFIVEEKLFASGENEFIAAIYTFEDSILKVHGRLPREGM
jgi:hypothetical protein